MSVDYDDVKELLSSKLEPPPTASGDPSMTSMTLLYSVVVAESRAEKAERACHVAEAALVRAKQKLLECRCQEPYTSLPVPSFHLSRRASSVILQQDYKQKQSGSEERQADDDVYGD